MRKTPTRATMKRQSKSSTLWLVQMPSVPMRREGAYYYVTTYPDSDLIFIETAVFRRPVSELVGRKIAARARAAIKLEMDKMVT